MTQKKTRGKKNYRRKNHHATSMIKYGVMRIESSGVAYAETTEAHFFVSKKNLKGAMNGDRVSFKPIVRRGGRTDGLILGIISRAQSSFVGIFSPAGPLGVVRPLDVRIHQDFFILPTDPCVAREKIREGDVVCVRIVEYPSQHAAGVVTITSRLGDGTTLDLGIESVVASYGLSGDFSAAALQETKDIDLGVKVALATEPSRIDLRDQCTVTIDPANAQDFDDAIHAHQIQGGYELCVHIADVSHYVRSASAIDQDAQSRACSAYLADRVIPMLPERLCNDICSLRPGADRLTFSIRMKIDLQGNIVSTVAMPAVICSSARLDYDSVNHFLVDGSLAEESLCGCERIDDVLEMLHILDKIAFLRRKVRYERGALDFDTAEPQVLLDKEGHPLRVLLKKKTRATSLVEEAMLATNESVAQMLAKAHVQTAFRVHTKPTPEDFKTIIPVLQGLGVLSSDLKTRFLTGDPTVLQEVIQSAKDEEERRLISLLLLRVQEKAIYLPKNLGHYALGASAYCHFTSPIRRYPDIVVHRALKNLLAANDGEPFCDDQRERLAKTCSHCSEKERAADAASHASQKIKIAELFREHVGEVFSGRITGVERRGLFVTLEQDCISGLLAVDQLGREPFVLDEKRMRLMGQKSGQIWYIGQQVHVRVIYTDPMHGWIDFALANEKVA
jgi:ribonuclease R